MHKDFQCDIAEPILLYSPENVVFEKLLDGVATDLSQRSNHSWSTYGTSNSSELEEKMQTHKFVAAIVFNRFPVNHFKILLERNKKLSKEFETNNIHIFHFLEYN